MTAATKQEIRSGASRPMTALVLDDDRFDRKRLVRWAQSMGQGRVIMKEAADLRSFSTLASAETFDLMFIDVYLADGDGLDAVTHLSTTSNASAYIAMMSGRYDENLRKACLERGCDRFINKAQFDRSVFRRILQGVARRQPEITRPGAATSAVSFWADRARRRDARIAAAPEQKEAVSQHSDLRHPLMQRQVRVHLPEFADTDEFIFRFPAKFEK